MENSRITLFCVSLQTLAKSNHFSLIPIHLGKKKSKFKSIKKFFGKRKRKETLTSSGSGNINTCQSAIDISATPSKHIDYDSEDDLK